MLINGELWSNYRRTWQAFSLKLYEMQELADSGQSVRLTALRDEVKQARLEHNTARDRLAEYFTAQETEAANREHYVRNTARLIWEFSGQPRNSAEKDWYRAEELVRTASV